MAQKLNNKISLSLVDAGFARMLNVMRILIPAEVSVPPCKSDGRKASL